MKKVSSFAILVATSSAAAPSVPELRMTPTHQRDKGDTRIGSSNFAGGHTKDSGLATPQPWASIPFCYSSLHSRSFKLIRIATTAWQRSCPETGTLDMERISMKSFFEDPSGGQHYSEPDGVDHFARTAELPVVVQISGFAPTDIRYFNPADDLGDQKGSK